MFHLKLPKKWLLSLLVLVMGVSLVGVAYAAPAQSWLEMMKNDPNPMNMNTYNNQDTKQTTNTVAKTNQQPAVKVAQVSTNNSNTQKAATTQNDLYNQMYQLCLQTGMPNCPMLNGSQMTREQMIKYCLGMYNQYRQQQPNSQISQQNLQAMQQLCQQWYNQYYPQNQKSTATPANNQRKVQYSNNWNNNMNQNWSNNMQNNGQWSQRGQNNWGYCGW